MTGSGFPGSAAAGRIDKGRFDCEWNGMSEAQPTSLSLLARVRAREADAWGRLSAGEGSQGPRWYDWACLQLPYTTAAGMAHWLLVRRSVSDPSELAYYRVYGPADTPVGEMVRAQQRHGFRPAHIHFLIGGEGYRELVTALYFGDDEHIDSDTVFGVSGSLVVNTKDDPGSPIPGLRAVRYDFRLARAEAGDTGRVGADPSKLMKAAERRPGQARPSPAMTGRRHI